VIPCMRTAGGREAPESPAPLAFTTLTGVGSLTGYGGGTLEMLPITPLTSHCIE
jgi:hypothetical protein